MQLTSTHFFSLIITLLVTMLPGILAARQVKSAEDYNVGGRSAGAGMVAGTIIGTIVGGAATVGTAQLGFKLGLTAWWFTLGSGIALMLMAIFYSVPLRRSGLTTIAEFLVTNYGKPAGWLATLSACAGIFFSIVASTLTALHLVAGIFNVPLTLAAGVIILVTAALVFFGGLSSSGMAGIFKIMLIFASIFVGGDTRSISGAAVVQPVRTRRWRRLIQPGRNDCGRYFDADLCAGDFQREKWQSCGCRLPERSAGGDSRRPALSDDWHVHACAASGDKFD